uniref:SH2 domain-containing protein n=1 Tax=Glossina pallidipes TaxID=7398 RepID=A0A1B0AJJ2_GLOPL
MKKVWKRFKCSIRKKSENFIVEALDVAAFDVTDKDSWYFGPLSRQDATKILMNERERGVFLVRDSNSIIGDYVLFLSKTIELFIVLEIKSFENLPKLLTFYTLHYLDTTPLRRPVAKKTELVIGKFDFEGIDQDDLSFRRGEVLTVIHKHEDGWWTAKNAMGKIGQIPVPYIQKYDESSEDNFIERPSSGNGNNCGSSNNIVKQSTTLPSMENVPVILRSLG